MGVGIPTSTDDTMFCLAFALLGNPVALAEDSEFAGTDAPTAVAESPESTMSAEFGGSLASGNVAYYTVNSGLIAGHRWDANKLSVGAAINIGRAVSDADANGMLDDTERDAGLIESARRYSIEGRYDRFVGPRDSLYVLAGAFADPFAGYDLRSHEQLGYSRTLLDDDRNKLLGELGFDWAQENYVRSVAPGYQDIYALRQMIGFEHKFSDAVGFSNTLEAYENVLDFKDVRVLNTAALTSSLSEALSLRLSHQLTFDNVPVEGFRATDQTTMVTLVASIL
jgi:putative salt-induced outer membrane protein YdiY